jgi:hypothetical protein
MFQRAGLNKTEISVSSRLVSSQSNSTLEPAKHSPMLSTTLSASEIVKKYTLYPFRWLMQAFFTVSMIVSGFLMVGFSPISNTIAKIYDCSQIIVQLQTLLFLIAFIPGNFIVIWVLNKYGLRATVGDNYILLVLILNLIDYDRSGDDTGGGLAEAASLNNWEI